MEVSEPNYFTLIKWKFRGFKIEEAKEWIEAGYDLMKAIEYKNKGIKLSDIGKRKI
ncbi:MAG: hypothetical protein P8Y70_15070 [Candidatus Lokiarchaeota archaeon]